MRFFVIFFLFIYCTTILSQVYNLDGVKLHSKDKPQQERTSISLNEEGPIELKNHFAVSFDISFWSLKYFGPIFRAFNNDKELVRLVFNHFQDKENYLLQLFLGDSKDPLVVKLDRSSFSINEWINIKIEFDLKTDSVFLYLNDRPIENRRHSLPEKINLYAYFGLIELGDIMDYDLAAVYLKNILIEENYKQKHFWQLNPYDNHYYLDKIDNRKILLTNTDWLLNDHYYWYKKSEFTTNSYPLFAYDSTNSKIFIDVKDRLIIFDLVTQTDSIINYKNHRPGLYHMLLYDEFRNKLYSTFWGQGPVSVYDFTLNEWTAIDTTGDVNGHYYGSVKFINPADSLIYMYGGYGWYTAKDKLFKYNFNTAAWEEVSVSTSIGYKFNLAVGQGFNTEQYLFWGGFGNETGKQEEGFIQYHDLYSFDLVSRNFNKIWSYKNGEEFKKYSHLFHNLYLDVKDSSFYFFRDYIDSNEVFLQLFKGDLKKSGITKVGKNLFNGYRENTGNVFICFNSGTNEFILVKKDINSSKVVLYGLRYPPIQDQLLLPVISKKETRTQFLIILFLGSILLLSIFIYLFTKGKKSKRIQDVHNLTPEIEHKTSKNYIKTFGGLSILNSQGIDILSQFSPKLKEIFVLILIRSINNHNSGITSEELSVTIWPDSSPESAKSNRGVAINKIRKALTSVPGIELEFNNKLWVAKIEGEAKCDYLEYLKIRSLLKNDYNANNELFANCLSLLEEGEFLKGISYEWLDSFKLAVNNEIIALLKEFLNGKSKQQPNDVNLKLKICDIILKFDSVDEDVFKFKIRTHYRTGNHQLAKNAYKIFIAEYKHLYDEEYPQTFQEILISK